MSDQVSCSFCGHLLKETGSKIWKTEGGEQIQIPVHDRTYAVIDAMNDDLVMCEACYQSSRIAELTDAQQQDFHFQFGLEYRQSEQWIDAMFSFVKSLTFKVDPKVLAELSSVCQELSRPEDSRFFLNRCLMIDPIEPIARGNKR